MDALLMMCRFNYKSGAHEYMKIPDDRTQWCIPILTVGFYMYERNNLHARVPDQREFRKSRYAENLPFGLSIPIFFEV